MSYSRLRSDSRSNQFGLLQLLLLLCTVMLAYAAPKPVASKKKADVCLADPTKFELTPFNQTALFYAVKGGIPFWLAKKLEAGMCAAISDLRGLTPDQPFHDFYKGMLAQDVKPENLALTEFLILRQLPTPMHFQVHDKKEVSIQLRNGTKIKAPDHNLMALKLKELVDAEARKVIAVGRGVDFLNQFYAAMVDNEIYYLHIKFAKSGGHRILMQKCGTRIVIFDPNHGTFIVPMINEFLINYFKEIDPGINIMVIHTKALRKDVGFKAPADQAVLNDFLDEAVALGDLVAMKKLADAGANVNMLRRNGQSLLHAAADYGRVAVVKYLLDKGVKVNLGNPALAAAQNGHIEVLTLLAEAGADLQVADESGNMPLTYAAQNGHEAVVIYLLEKCGAKSINHCRLDDGATALMLAAKNGRHNVVHRLLIAGADPNISMLPKAGQLTPLFMAVQNLDYKMVALLLNYKADPNQAIVDGMTPLRFAVEKADTNMIALLLYYGADARVLPVSLLETPVLKAAQELVGKERVKAATTPFAAQPTVQEVNVEAVPA